MCNLTFDKMFPIYSSDLKKETQDEFLEAVNAKHHPEDMNWDLEIYFRNGKKISLHLDDDEKREIVDDKLFVNAVWDNLNAVRELLLHKDNTED